MAAVSDDVKSEERVTNIHGEGLSSRVEKYKIEDGDQKHTSPITASSSLSSSHSSITESAKLLNTRSKASPTNSAAARAQKTKNKNYEQLLIPAKQRTNHNYEQLGSKRFTDGSSHQNGINGSTTTTVTEESVPITIPKDGNIQNFSVDELAAFFRYMKVDEQMVQRLKNKALDGRRFGKLKDKTLEDLGMKNPIMLYFRDRSSKERVNFML